jgi:hypothetical protein
MDSCTTAPDKIPIKDRHKRNDAALRDADMTASPITTPASDPFRTFSLLTDPRNNEHIKELMPNDIAKDGIEKPN